MFAKTLHHLMLPMALLLTVVGVLKLSERPTLAADLKSDSVLMFPPPPSSFLRAPYSGTSRITSIFDHTSPSRLGLPDNNIDAITDYRGRVALKDASGQFKFSGIDKPVSDGSNGHPGYDYDFGTGHPVLAVAASDNVLDAGWYDPANHTQYGLYVKLDHGPATNNAITLYAHLSAVFVSRGTCSPNPCVNQSDIIGLVGTTGDSTGSHLHFEIRDGNGNYIDPYGWEGIGNPVWAPQQTYSLWQDGYVPSTTSSPVYADVVPAGDPPLDAPAPTNPPTDLVVDDGLDAFQQTCASESIPNANANGGASFYILATNDPAAQCTVTWTLVNQPAGYYQVYVSIPEDLSPGDANYRPLVDDVVYTVNSASGISYQVRLSQENLASATDGAANNWVYIGQYQFDGANNTVVLSNKTEQNSNTRYVAIDAVLFLPIGQSPQPTPTNRPTFTPTSTYTFTPTNTFTFTPTSTGTFTPTLTPTSPPSSTFTPSPTSTSTATHTSEPGVVCTPTPTPTSSASQNVLYDQTDHQSTYSVNSQNHEVAQNVYDTQGADDFVVPASDVNWTVKSIHIMGKYYDAGTRPLRSFNIRLYRDVNGRPEAWLYYQALAVFPATTTTNLPFATYVINLNTPAVLPAGKYWVSVQANLNYLPEGNAWGWRMRTIQSLDPSVWRNPNNGYGTGCTSWSLTKNCVGASESDFLFQLRGTTGVPASGSGNECVCVTSWLNNSSANSGVAHSVIYRSIQVAQQTILDLQLLYRVRDEVLNQTPQGQHYIELHYVHSPEMISLFANNATLKDEAIATIQFWEPMLQALVDGSGNSVTITAGQVQTVQTFLDHLSAVASPALQQTIADERAQHPLEEMIGKTMDDAWIHLNEEVNTSTPTPTASETPSATSTPTLTATNTATATVTPTATRVLVVTQTRTPRPTSTSRHNTLPTPTLPVFRVQPTPTPRR